MYCGVNHHGLGDLAQAIASAQDAVRIFGQLDDRQGLGYARMVHGMALIDSGSQDLASAELHAAARLFREVGHQQGEAHSMRALGRAQSRAQDHRAAADSYRRALAALGPEGNPADHAILNMGLASELSELGEHDAALRQARSAAVTLLTLRRLGNRFLLTRANHVIGQIELASGRTDAPIRRFAAVAESYRELDARLWQARALRDLGAAWRLAGQPDQARAALTRSLALLTDQAAPDVTEVSALLAALDSGASSADSDVSS
jgi:tetratricopeptide (TPR) repeat protein